MFTATPRGLSRLSIYKPVLTRSKPSVRQIKGCPEGGADVLQDCFERTDWSVFKEAATEKQVVNVEQYPEAVPAYIQKRTSV